MTRQDRHASPPAHCDVIALRITPELRKAIGDAAAARRMSVSGWLRDAAATIVRLQGIEA
jgi:uncharacterized protein (DUF1778 family)